MNAGLQSHLVHLEAAYFQDYVKRYKNTSKWNSARNSLSEEQKKCLLQAALSLPTCSFSSLQERERSQFEALQKQAARERGRTWNGCIIDLMPKLALRSEERGTRNWIHESVRAKRAERE